MAAEARATLRSMGSYSRLLAALVAALALLLAAPGALASGDMAMPMESDMAGMEGMAGHGAMSMTTTNVTSGPELAAALADPTVEHITVSAPYTIRMPAGWKPKPLTRPVTITGTGSGASSTLDFGGAVGPLFPVVAGSKGNVTFSKLVLANATGPLNLAPAAAI